MIAPGNSGTHTVKIVNASTLAEVPGGSTTVITVGGTAGSVAYGPLAAPVTLAANTAYYIMTLEAAGDDRWFDDTTVQTTSDAAVSSMVWSNGPFYPWGPAGHAYVPVTFRYTVPISVGIYPTTVSLSALQTQQFTATVTGSGNTAVTWGISPANAGTISPAGLYTAPASIGTQQTVTVTATSVADPTKYANASVTLNPPPPPSITQQPQNATVPAGQTAPFTVTANGGSSHQWQSMRAGAGLFNNIASATSSSYTTPATALSNNGAQYRCMVSDGQGSVTSNAAILTVQSPGMPGTPFLTQTILGRLRADFSGWVGMSVTVGAQPLVVSSLGRMVAPGNSGAHTLKIVAASTGVDVTGASVTVNTAGTAVGPFVYSALPNPITLTPNTTYYFLSQETWGGDQWYDYDTVAQTTSDASLVAAVWSSRL
jgi:hypothetical protein